MFDYKKENQSSVLSGRTGTQRKPAQNTELLMKQLKRKMTEPLQQFADEEEEKQLKSIFPNAWTTKEKNKYNQEEDNPPKVLNGVYFVEIPKFSLSFVVKGNMNSFTNTIDGSYQSSKREFYVNLQQYQSEDITSYIGIFPTWGTVSPFVTMGQNVENGERTGLSTDESRAYFAKNMDGDWISGLGNPPQDAIFGFGGGIPMCINEQMFGEEDEEDIISARGYANQNSPDVGKVIIAHNSQTNSLMLVVSPDELESGGMTLDQIRDYLFSLGYNNILSFDGGSSATLIMDNEVLVSPVWYKDNTIPIGLKVTEE